MFFYRPNRRPKSAVLRKAFSLIELQMVLAAAVVVTIMVLPAMQNMREAARDMECQNRLADMATASLVYEVVNERLPAELSGQGAKQISEYNENSEPGEPAWRANQHTSLHIQIAPFMGLEAIVDNVDPLAFDFDRNLIGSDFIDLTRFYFGTPDALGFELQVNVPEFTCSSDNINEVRAFAMGLMGSTYVSDPNTEDIFNILVWVTADQREVKGARTNYLGCFGASTGGDNRGGNLGAFRGAVGHREIRRSEMIPDGTTNTVLFGESLGTIQWRLDTGEIDRDFTQLWYMGANGRGRGGVEFGASEPYNTRTGITTEFFAILNADNPDFPNPEIEPDPRQGILGSAFHARSFGFGSMHPDGVNFAMLDGSVRTVARTSDWKSLYAIFGAFDSQENRSGFRLSK